MSSFSSFRDDCTERIVAFLVPLTGLSLQSFIGFGLALGKTTQSGHHDYGTVLGANTTKSSAQAVWNVFNALGNACFSFNFSPILIEIADTVAQPPSEARSMKRATRTSVSISVYTLNCIASTLR